MLLLALADNAARSSEPHASALYWVAVVALVAPIAARLTREACSRAERIGLVLVVGLAMYLLKLMTWPLGFAFHDDLGQLRTTLDIGTTHHLFSTNPIVGRVRVLPRTRGGHATLLRPSPASVLQPPASSSSEPPV